jgi:hypothetical protein
MIGGLNELIFTRHLEQLLAHDRNTLERYIVFIFIIILAFSDGLSANVFRTKQHSLFGSTRV